MGVLVATGVHYSQNGRCLAAQVFGDNPPQYDQLDLRLTLPGPSFQDVTGVGPNPRPFPVAPGEPPAPPADPVEGTWHYPGDCPNR